MKTIAEYYPAESNEVAKINLSKNHFYLTTFDKNHIYDNGFFTLSELVLYHIKDNQ